MQLKLPIFPIGTKLLCDCVGVYEQDGIVQYIVNGSRAYAYGKDDLQAFRFLFSNLISQGLCTKVQIRKAFSITEDYINPGIPALKKEGEAGFFKPENRHGYCYKLIGETLKKAQQLLDEGQCQNATAKAVGESAIRYLI